MVKINYTTNLKTIVKRGKSVRSQIDALRKKVGKKNKKWDSAKIVRSIRDGR